MNPGEAVSIRQPFARSAERRVTAALTASTAMSALAIGVAAIALRLVFGAQLDGLDDAGYLNAAQRVAEGQPLDSLFALFRTRVGMSYPLGWAIGHGWLEPSQFWVLTLLADTITLVSLIAAGTLIAGRAAAGLCAAGLYAVYPLAVQQSMLYYPTAFQVASIAAACAAIAIAERAGGRRGLIVGAAGGLALGLGYLFKEDVAIVVPAIAAVSLLTRYPSRRTAVAVCAGAAAVFAAECATYAYFTGQPLLRLTASSGLGAPISDQLQLAQIWRWDAFLRSLWLMPVQVGLMWWLAIPAAWMAFRAREHRGLVFIAALFVVVMLYLQFGSGSLTSYSPLPKTPRYTALATPLLMLLAGAWLSAQMTSRPRLARAAAAAIALVAVPCLFYLAASSSERTRNTLAATPIVAALAPSPVFTDYYTARIMRLLLPGHDIRVWFHADFKSNTTYLQERPAPGSLVLLDQQAAKVYTSSYEMSLPDGVSTPPAEWQVLATQRAYADGSLARGVLEGIRRAVAQLPENGPGSRVNRNIADMIDHDRAILYRVP